MVREVVFLKSGGNAARAMACALARRILPPEIRVATGQEPEEMGSAGIEALREAGIQPPVPPVLASSTVPVNRGAVGIDGGLADDAAEGLWIALGAGSAQVAAGASANRRQWDISPAEAVGESLAAARSLRDRLAVHLFALADELRPAPALGILGGSGFYRMPGVSEIEEVAVETPFGAPSDHFFIARLHGRRVVFLARHGRKHHLLPHEVNHRANFYGFKRLGVTRVLSASAVGSLREEIQPGDAVVPRQFIDRTHTRPATLFGGGVVVHASLADPVCEPTADVLAACAKAFPGTVHVKGTYICIEGPQFSTRAESELYRQWGADIVGMTNLPEARIAREAEICYATLTLPTDYDCWRKGAEEANVPAIMAVLRANVEKGEQVIRHAVERLDPAAACRCGRELDVSLMTPPDAIAVPARIRLHALLQRRLGLRAAHAV